MIGQDDAITQVKAYMDGQAIAPAALFSGPIGVGKSTLAKAIAEEYDLEPLNLYGTECRGKRIDYILATVKTSTFNGKKRMVIIKSAEGADEDFLLKLLDIMVPTILTTTRSQELHWKINSSCQHVVFQKPTREDLIEYILRAGKEFPGEQIVAKMHSFADARNWILGGDPTTFQSLTELEEARAIFGGHEIGEYRMKFPRLMDYYLYNGGNPMLASHLDLMVHENNSSEGLKLLRSQTLTGIINIPYQHWKGRGKRGVYIRVLGFVD